MKVKFLRALCLLIASFSFTSNLSAEVPACFSQLERDFFRPDIVSEALSIQSIGQSNWAIINSELRERAKKVPEMVKERARKLIPNPLAYPYDPAGAQALLEEVLQQVLAETLSLFQIYNRAQIGEIYGYIKQKQIDRFNRCFGSQQ